MPIIIVLLATIVAFLFGGPILAIAALLIGLIVVFPNVVGVIAAGIGTIILLSVLLGTLSEKWDINPDSLISIIVLVIIGLLGLIFLADYIVNGQTEKSKKNQIDYQRIRREKAEYQKLQDELGVKYSLVENDNKVQKYIVEPNTVEVWEALKNTLFSHGERFRYERHNIENNLIILTNKYDNEIKLVKSKSGIELILKNFTFLPDFVRNNNIEEKIEITEKKSSTVNLTEKDTSDIKEKQVDISSNNSNHIDDLVKLSSLLKDGLITEDEFESEKAKLL